MKTLANASNAMNHALKREQDSTPGRPADLVRASVLAVLRRELLPSIPLHGAMRLTTDLGVDSLAMMELIFSLEDRFAVSIPLESVARINTVDDLVDELKWHLMHRPTRVAA